MTRLVAALVLLRTLQILGGEILASHGALAEAGWVDPLSFDVRSNQVEVLLHMKPPRLKEAALLARDAAALYPGYIQARAMLATVLVLGEMHGKAVGAREAAEEALLADPQSVFALERLMMLLAYRRRPGDMALFRELGIRRARLTREGLRMKCPLCGRHWLAHRGVGW